MKAYRYRIYPNSEQQGLLEKHFDCVRHVDNWALALKDKLYHTTAPIPPIVETDQILGLNVGIHHFYTDSEGNSIPKKVTLSIGDSFHYRCVTGSVSVAQAMIATIMRRR